MTIEEMRTMSYVLLAVAVMLGIIAIVWFITLKIPKAYRAVKEQKSNKKRCVGKKQKYYVVQNKKKKGKSNLTTVKLEENGKHILETEVLSEEKIRFTILQDITYVFVKESYCSNSDRIER